MFKYTILLMVFLVAGCQTTGTGKTPVQSEDKLSDRSEKLLLRVEQIVGTYEVTVQRAALQGNDPKSKDQWSIIGSSNISGYPGTFRTSDGSTPVSGRKGTYLLAGATVPVSLEPGVHLVAKVIPELQNTARVVGVFVQVTPNGDCFETFAMPFDVTCNLGDVLQLYAKEVPVGFGIPADIYSLLE